MVIGITSSYIQSDLNYFRLSEYYATSIQKYATPIILPILHQKELIHDYLRMVDALIFSGGGDISPYFYKEDPIRNVEHVEWERDYFELELFKQAYEKRIPILGICRGMQIMNVALGGTLYQDIDTQCDTLENHHPKDNLCGLFHEIYIEKDTHLQKIFNVDRLLVNSHHHQSVKKIAADCIVSARSKDGIVEAIEYVKDSDHLMFGVQFHPEMLYQKHPAFEKLFQYFVTNSKKASQ